MSTRLTISRFQNGSTLRRLHMLGVGRDIGRAFLGRTKSDDPVCNIRHCNPWKYYREFRESLRNFPTWRSHEDGEKRGESRWTLFYATPVLSESDQKFRVRERKIERELKAGGVNYCLTAVKNNDSWNQANFYPWKLVMLLGGKMRMVSLRSWVVVFRCWCFL